MLTRRVLVLAGAAVLISSSCVFAATQGKVTPKAKSSNVAAIVNGQTITTKQLQDTLYKWYAPQGVQEMTLIILVDREAKKAGVTVSDAQVTAKIKEIEKRASAGGMSFSDYLKQTGKTLEYAKAMVRMELQANAVLRKNEKVTADDLAGYRKAEHILITPAIAPEASAEADQAKVQADADKAMKDKIDSIAQEIKNGLSFEDAAKKYSQDTMNAPKGGDLGWFGKGQMVPEFEKAAFALKPGEISEPVRTPFGYHLIKLIAVGNEATGADKQQLVEKIMQSRINVRAWITQLQNSAKVQSEFVPAQRPTPPARGPRASLSPLPTKIIKQPVDVKPATKGQETPPPPPAQPSTTK